MHFYSPPHRAARRLFPLWALLLWGLPLMLCAAGCGTQAQNARKAQDYLAEALRHAQTDPKDTEARQWTDRAIAAASPHDPAVYLGPTTLNAVDGMPPLSVALVFSAVGDNQALADYMTQAVQKYPNDERGYQLLIAAQQQLGQTAAAQASAAKLAALLQSKISAPGATDLASLTTALGQAYFDAGDTVRGTATYKKAIQAYPAEAGPLNNLAYAYAVRGTNLPEALTLAQNALALARKKGDDETTLAQYQDTLGWVQYQQGNYAEAEQNLLQAANTLPRQAETRYHLGLVAVAQGRMDAARSELTHAVRLAQGYAAAQQALDTLPKTAAAKP